MSSNEDQAQPTLGEEKKNYMKLETVQRLEKNIGKSFLTPVLRTIFGYDTKSTSNKGKNKSNYIKLKSFCSAKHSKK